MKAKFLLIILTVSFSLEAFAGANDSIMLKLYSLLAKDTFPIKINHQTIQAYADFAVVDFKRTDTTTVEYHPKKTRAYWYQLLAGNAKVADSIFKSADANNESSLPAMRGYRALSNMIKGISKPLSPADSLLIENDLNVAISFNAEPIAVWKWLLKMFEQPQESPIFFPFEKKPLPFKPFNDSLLGYEGAMLPFEVQKGKLALIICSGGIYESLKYWEKNKSGVWEDKTGIAGLSHFPGGNKIYALDYNNDGLKDILLLRKTSRSKYPVLYPSSLLKNNGNGTFTDVTYSSGFFFQGRPTSAAIADFNNDGLLDIFVAMDGQPSMFFVQKSDNTFTNSAFSLGINTDKNNVADCSALDFNADGLMDLYLSYNGALNKLFIQQVLDGKYHFFINKAEDFGKIKEPYFSGLIWTGYFDSNHGNIDLLVQSDANKVPYFFQEIKSGMSNGGLEPQRLFLHVDKDSVFDYPGIAELYVAQAGVKWHQPEGFYMISGGGNAPESLFPFSFSPILNGVEDGKLMPSFESWDYSLGWPSSLAVDDINADGVPELLVMRGGRYPLTKLSPVVLPLKYHEHQYLKVNLQGVTSNRDGIGATITLYVKKADGSTVNYQHWTQAPVSTGNGSVATWWHIERGDKVEKIEVQWPGQKNTEVFFGSPNSGEILLIQNSKKVSLISSSK